MGYVAYIEETDYKGRDCARKFDCKLKVILKGNNL
jgi:hypothetical protein